MDFSNDSVIHVKGNGIEYIQFRRLLEYQNKLIHAYSLKPLDYKMKSKDDANYISICNALGLDNNEIVAPQQTHTNNVGIVLADSDSSNFQNTDGLITNEKNKALSAVFADCNSILLYDPVKNVIGNIHSGWRGTVARIGEVAVNKMVDVYGCNAKDIICCLGPSIRQCHFEVEDDVRSIFLGVFEDSTIIKDGDFRDGKQRYNIDTIAAIKKTLERCGVQPQNIIDSGICTVCNKEFFHSYRAEKNEAGRNGSIMCLV